MGRSPSNNKNGVKKGPWDPEEDKKLTDYINKNGAGSWISLPKLAGLNRCGKSCRLRWINYLRPEIKRGNFSPEEEQTILHFHRILGNKWSLIATKLPGRTDNEIKNYWNTHLRKKLIREGFDPITHQPQTDVVSCLKLLAIANLNSIINQNPLAYKLQCLQQQLLRSSQIDQIPSSMVNSISLPLIKENPILYSLPQLENEASFSLGTTISQPLHHPMTSTAPSPFSNNSLQDPQPKDVPFTFSPQAMTTSLDGFVGQIPEFGELDSLWNMVCSVPSTSDLVPSTVTETTSISNLGEVTSTLNYNGSDAPYSPWPGLLNDPDMP